MSKKILAAATIAAFAAIAAPAHAEDWNAAIDLCTAAIDAEGAVSTEDYRVKFVSAGGGATKRLNLKLIPIADGETIKAECKVRRGEVTGLDLKA